MTPRTPTTDQEEVEALTKALTGLTCGGSEFFIRKGDRYVADIDACVAWVRRAKEDAHRRSINAILARQAAEAKVDTLRAEVEGLREALEKIAVSGNGGHWGRLARAALLPTSQPLKEGEDHAV